MADEPPLPRTQGSPQDVMMSEPQLMGKGKKCWICGMECLMGSV